MISNNLMRVGGLLLVVGVIFRAVLPAGIALVVAGGIVRLLEAKLN